MIRHMNIILPNPLAILLNMVGTGQVAKLADQMEKASVTEKTPYNAEMKTTIAFLRKLDTARPEAEALLKRGSQIAKEIQNAPKN